MPPYRAEEPESALEVGLDQDSLSWRKMIEGANLTGPIKNLASQAQVVSITREEVTLRTNTVAFATESNRELLEKQLKQYLHRAFRVNFEVGEITSTTVSEAVQKEQLLAQEARVNAFKNLPTVKLFMNELGAVVEPGTVKKRDVSSS